VDLNLKIKGLSNRQLKTLEFRCLDCDYWFDYDGYSFIKELIAVRSFRGLEGLFKGKIFEKISEKKNKGSRSKIIAFKMHGGKVKAAFAGKRCVGAILAGSYYLFPRLRNFDVFPPDFDSIFLGCIHVISEYRGMGVEKRLLIEVEKDLIKEKAKSIEAIGKRLDDDMDEEEYENSPLIPFKFLMNNGFYLKKNDPLYPLLRLDLGSIAFDFARSRVPVGKVVLEKEAGSPLIVKDK
jgi:ribosomal protein S18 acetylase RimI-like enzyme